MKELKNKIEILRECLFDVIQNNKRLIKEHDQALKEIEKLKLENKRLKQKLSIKDQIIKKGGR